MGYLPRVSLVLSCLAFFSIPALAVTISPTSATVTENATKQFTASTPSTWTTTCGSVSTTGLFKAPLYPSTTCKITAKATNGSGTVTAAVTVISAIVITPPSAKTPQGKTQQFTANMPVAWTAKCGSISASGLFTASGTVGTSCTIEAMATAAPKYTAYGYDAITAPTSTAPLSVTPGSATVTEAATQQFTASTPATWTTTCGSVSSAGLFKAPLYPSNTCKVTATATNGSAGANVTVVSAIVISPPSAKTPQGKTQQFTANMPVSWSAKCGTISAAGLYTASGTVGTSCTIEAMATTAPQYTAYGFDTITAPGSTTVSISPLNPSVKEGATQQFTASTASTFKASCGSISSAGLFTAPLSPGSCTITATATNGSGATATTAATVTSPITISPASTVTAQGQTQQFSANTPVTWSTSCGSISAAGLFTASATPGSACAVKATASSGTAYTATALDSIGAASALTITPLSPTLPAGTHQQFTSSVASTWTASCGAIGTTTGLYTAPATPGPCTVTATATDGSGHVTSTVVTVSAALAITPGAITTAQGQTQQFTANYPVSWSASCGGINSTGLFTASASAGSVCTITATATSGPANSATASDTIGAAGAFTLSPLTPAVVENATQQFTTNVPATFTASCGTINAGSGLYTAALTPGTCQVTATATDGSGATASTTVTVNSPINITPSNASLHALNTQSFTANQPVTWSASCGSVSGAGVFTAPGTQTECTLTATASGSPAYTATATVDVDVVNQVRWRNNQGGTGLQPNELLLTPANVNSSSFGQAWSAAVDGGVWAQPLYMNALAVNGATHNVLFVATDNDSVYAIDADTGAQLWQVSLLPAGATAVAGTMVDDQYIASIGILGTPVIDNDTLYVVAETAEQGATYFPHRLHALDLATGNEKFGGPVLISDPNLQPAHKLQRPGLTIANGTVYVATGSLGDKAPYHGLLFAFDENTLAQTGVWNSTPSGTEGGIWQAGGAPSVDSDGNLYVVTGNGYADAVNNFGESAVKLGPNLQMQDFFSPYNAATLTASDLDLGSASVPVMPDQDGPFPHVLIFCGKSPTIYVVNRDSMGHMGSTSDNVVQEVTNAVGGTATGRDSGQACFTSPSAWGANVYFIANGDVLKQFNLDPATGQLSTTAVHQGAFAYGWPGSQSMISSNGDENGIIWTFDNVGKTLHADDATDVSKSLYVSPAISTGYVKWTTPTVINGHVYIGGTGTVVAFSTH